MSMVGRVRHRQIRWQHDPRFAKATAASSRLNNPIGRALLPVFQFKTRRARVPVLSFSTDCLSLTRKRLTLTRSVSQDATRVLADAAGEPPVEKGIEA